MAWVQVVDDFEAGREMLLMLVQAGGFEAEAASSASAALARIFERGAPRVIITDLLMDDLDGVTFARAVRRSFPDSPIVIIAYTGLANYSDEEGLFDKVIIKPGVPNEVLSLVREAFAR